MPTHREVKVRPPVTLPALTTDLSEREYSFLSFLAEWVVGARGMRKDENLTHLFEWEEAIEAFGRKAAAKAKVTEPKPPPKNGSLRAEDDAEVRAYLDAVTQYREAVEKAAVGECLYVTDGAFLAARAAAKDAIDAASSPSARTLHVMFETKVLRHYHAFAQSRAIEENDVPRPAAAAAANGEGAVAGEATPS